jgi:prevent-host-death family protein
VDVGVRAFKNGLSGYLRRVRAGQRIVVTGRGRPMAVLTGVEKVGPDRRAADALVASGIATWGGGKPTGCPDPPKPRRGSAASAVLANRR